MRSIHDFELPLVHAALDAAGIKLDNNTLVESMKDGGMGSLLFQHDVSISNFGVVELSFKDSDGVPVSATLNTDAKGRPVELDVWKVDFSPLQKWPETQDILVERHNNQFKKENGDAISY